MKLKVNEKQFLSQVRQLARLYRWTVYHTRFSFGSDSGFPDLVLVRRGRLIFAELKTDTGRITPKQAMWLEALQEVARDSGRHPDGFLGVSSYVWRPNQLDMIQKILR